VKNERTVEDVQYFVTCTYCGTQTQLSLKQLEGDRPLKCRTCGAPFRVIPPKKPPKKPATKRKKPFDDYDAILAERHAYELRTEGEFKKAQPVVGFIIAALLATVIFFTLLLERC
jgi:DNA-directed RNA polymerase subunit RPC12/RpoP